MSARWCMECGKPEFRPVAHERCQCPRGVTETSLVDRETFVAARRARNDVERVVAEVVTEMRWDDGDYVPWAGNA